MTTAATWSLPGAVAAGSMSTVTIAGATVAGRAAGAYVHATWSCVGGCAARCSGAVARAGSGVQRGAGSAARAAVTV
jgi:hypothetical protein